MSASNAPSTPYRIGKNTTAPTPKTRLSSGLDSPVAPAMLAPTSAASAKIRPMKRPMAP
jgi:hypothetical protein